MLDRIDEIVVLAKRETPKIGGSAAAFIALVTILVLIIIVSCSAVVYILREDIADDAEAQNHAARGRYQLSVPPSDPTYRGTAKTYFTRILGNISGSRKPSKDVRKDKSRISRKHGQGWTQAGNGDDHDDSQTTRKQKSKNSDISTMSMSDLDSVSLATLTRLIRYSPKWSFDPHGIRGLPYANQLPSSSTRQSIMPSIQSQLYSPQSSQSLLSSPSRMTTTSPEPLERTMSPDSTDNHGDPFPTDFRPPLRTFESGSKFIEGL
ncbi:hypothetical protein M413DRAFT_438811 [Hebeloma cylindrosporum]|uniref:Uncharacterized protein n=1 Tax=Hebeloma cylindrosporum TaxID=76867 RepID=A0A0C2Z944_HEBCY|nr:hypothetical protein M413DRAFT_438811 [Hebeloma cylindrosporum h7]